MAKDEREVPLDTPSSLGFEAMSIVDDGHKRRSDVKAWKGEWKERLREICLERVRVDRSKLLWDNRLGGAAASKKPAANKLVGSAFEHIVADELQKAKNEGLQSEETEVKDMDTEGKDERDTLWEHETPDAPVELGEEEYEALMLAMEHALYEDMYAKAEGRDAALSDVDDPEKVHALENESETVHTLEDESLAAVVEHWQDHEEGLLCPLCRTRRLQQSQCSIYCGCGRFRIDTQSDRAGRCMALLLCHGSLKRRHYSQIGLDFLQKRLAEVLQEHIDSGCRGQGTFSIERRFGIGALYMQCAVCDCFQLVL